MYKIYYNILQRLKCKPIWDNCPDSSKSKFNARNLTEVR